MTNSHMERWLGAWFLRWAFLTVGVAGVCVALGVPAPTGSALGLLCLSTMLLAVAMDIRS